MKNNKQRRFLILLAAICFYSCKTTGRFTGSSNLTILIVDEKGCGVRDCALTLSNFNKEEHGVTNENGLCIFNNVPSGEYKLAGSKKGYKKMKTENFNYISKGEVFCFELYSCSFVFDEVEKLYEQCNFQKTLELLDEIVCDKKSSLYAAICFYKAYGYYLQKNQKSALTELNRMKKADKTFEEIYKEFITRIEIPDNENEKEEAL